jgi:hypothetical protein
MEDVKCCGSCVSFSNESTDGLGLCREFDELTSCGDDCDRWEPENE